MKENQLHTLISLHEEEEIRLQQLIDDCVKESEFLMAHYHHEALFRLNIRLRTLRIMHDKHYDEKVYLTRRIQTSQEYIDATDNEAMKEYFRSEQLIAEEGLEKLNQSTPVVSNPKQDNVLSEALQGLLDGKLKNFRLVLQKSDNLFLKISYSKKTITLTLPHVKLHIAKRKLEESTIEILKNMGFILNEKGSQLKWKFSGDKQAVLFQINLVLLKIVFEIFWFVEFRSESYIMFTEKRY